MKKEWIVPGEEAGKKLIVFLSERLKDYSSRQLKRMLESNQCQLNHRVERFASTVLAKGDYLVLILSDQSTPSTSLKMDPSQIIYEDESFLIYNKPAGINSDPNGIVKLLAAYHPRLHLIHRLDRDTTGVLLLAKKASIVDQMIEEFRQQHVSKCYMAIVDGILEKKEGTIQNYLGKKHVYEGQTIWGAVDAAHGLPAHTDWVKIQTGLKATLVYCYPHTGRTHQLRVHMAGIGHPILGDFQYSKTFQCAYQPNRYLLHAYQITFQHPVTKQMIDVKAPLPSDFKQAQKQLFKNSPIENNR